MKSIYRLLITCMLLSSCSKGNSSSSPEDTLGPQPDLPVVNGTETFTIPANGYYVNVMGSTIPRMPRFPLLDVKQHIARGYVADLKGNPIKNAHIGVSSSLGGGFYSSGSALTDEKGYYEFRIPVGAAYFFGTAVTITYNETPAVLALYPVGGTTGFPSGSGVVKNFVLLSYGPANPDEVAQQPNNESNYYGGAVSFNFNINYAGENVPEYLPHDGIVEIELIPVACLYGENKTFKIIRQISDVSTNFAIQNIPVGKYAISAKLSDGRRLKMSENGPRANVYEKLGLKTDAQGKAALTFTPSWQSTPVMIASFKSNWEAVHIGLKL